MKIALLLIAILLQFAAPSAHAAYYQWVDAQGVTNFTDDLDKVPTRYRKKARRLELSEEPAPAQVSAPPPQTPQAAQPPAPGPGTHPERWWRDRFSALRGELKTLQDGLPAKQANLAELRRKRSIYFRAQDREAINKVQADISADETRITDLQTRLDALEGEAARESVPTEWRQ